jgi:hypothetical protein
MANVNDPSGFREAKALGGGCDIPLENYTIASALAVNIGYGDPVKETGTGRNITAAAAGDAVLGVLKGVKYLDAQGRAQFSRGWVTGTVGTKIVALVNINPNVEFVCQADTCADTDVGALCDIVVGVPDAYGNSTSYAEGSATATTGKTLKILGLAEDPAGNAYGAYAKIRVKFVEHVMSGVVAGAGGV